MATGPAAMGRDQIPVSRETRDALVFGDALPGIQAYAQLLRTEGIPRGILGPREADRLWDRHLLNCAVVAPALATGASVADVGSGAGLPGVVLALIRPDLSVRLVEPLLRRAVFLEEAVEQLGLRGVEVVRSRAEDLHGRWTTDVVTARAVAPLTRLAAWCLPLVRPGGTLLALKGQRAQAELTAAAAGLPALGAATWSVQMYGEGLLDVATRVVRIDRSAGASMPSRPADPGGGREAVPPSRRRR